MPDPQKTKKVRVEVNGTTLDVVELVNLEALHEGNVESKYGKDWSGTQYKPRNRHKIGMKRSRFTIRRWFKAGQADTDLLYNLFENDTVFVLKEWLNDGVPGYSGLELDDCEGYGYSAETGGANDIIIEELRGEGLEWATVTLTTPPPPITCECGNVIVNGGFEDDLTSWTLESGVAPDISTVGPNPHDGSKYAEMYWDGAKYQGFTISQLIDISVVCVESIGLWYYAGDNTKSSLQVRYTDSTTTSVAIGDAGTSWVYVELTPTAGKTIDKISIITQDGALGICIDDITVIGICACVGGPQVLNSGFETGTSAGWTLNAGEIQNSGARSGTYCCWIWPAGARQLYQDFTPFNVDDVIQCDFWYKQNATDILNVYIYYSDFSYTTQLYNDNSGNWIHVDLIGTLTPAKQIIKILFLGGNDGGTRIDDVYITTECTDPPCGNLLTGYNVFTYYEDLGYVHPTSSKTGASAVGECFTSTDNEAICEARFYLKKIGLPIGHLVAKLWHITGVYGTDATPDALLATSDLIDMSDISTDLEWVVFPFSGLQQWCMMAGYYYITLEVADSTNIDGANYFEVARDDVPSPGYSGNYCYYNDGTWIAASNYDLTFRIYTTSSCVTITTTTTTTTTSTTSTTSTTTTPPINFWIDDTIGGILTLDLDAVDFKHGVNCLRLTYVDDDTHGMNIYHDYISDQDFSGYDYISFWWYGTNSGQNMFIDFINEDYATYSDGYYYIFVDNFTGWQYFHILRSAFTPYGTPTGWNHIKCVVFYNSDAEISAVWKLDYLTNDNGVNFVEIYDDGL